MDLAAVKLHRQESVTFLPFSIGNPTINLGCAFGENWPPKIWTDADADRGDAESELCASRQAERRSPRARVVMKYSCASRQSASAIASVCLNLPAEFRSRILRGAEKVDLLA